MRLVKRSINQDDPGNLSPLLRRRRRAPRHRSDVLSVGADGAAAASGTDSPSKSALEVPADSLAWWRRAAREIRRGDERGRARASATRCCRSIDPHGLRLALTESARGIARRVRAVGRQRRFRSSARSAASTARSSGSASSAPSVEFLTTVLGFARLGAENGWTRYGFADAPGILDLRETPDERAAPGASAACITWRGRWRTTRNSCACARRSRPAAAAPRRSSIASGSSRSTSRSRAACSSSWRPKVPGFAVDEDPAHLGEALVLPPWFEPARARDRAEPAAADDAGRRTAGSPMSGLRARLRPRLRARHRRPAAATLLAPARHRRRRARPAAARPRARARRQPAQPARARSSRTESRDSSAGSPKGSSTSRI